MTSYESTANVCSAEQELGKILELLNPPQQDYDLLANKALRLQFDSCLPPGPSLERALAEYFELFTYGYDKWQGCYDYHKIHEYFYVAYLQAIQAGGSCLSPHLRAMLEQTTHAFIAYTWCENALLCNDPKGLLDRATRAIECGTAALTSLAHSSLGLPLHAPIEQYLRMNIDLWSGFKLCAEMYLAPLRNEHIPSATLSEVRRLLKSLENRSRELTSELRAHFSFAQRFAQAHAHRNSDLRAKRATLLLRASGYVGEDLTAELFGKLAKADTILENELDAICDKTCLPIKSVRLASMQGIFETVLGKDYLKQIIFELPIDNHNLTFSVRDGEKEVAYSVETFQVRLARFGVISVEFEISIEDASVSHVRVLESLIAPYAGRFDFVWRDAPQDIGRGSTNYVDYFLRSQQWIQSIRVAMKNELSLTVAEMEKVLTDWEKALCELTKWLHPKPQKESCEQAEPSRHNPAEPSNGSSEKAEGLDSVYRTLHKQCFQAMPHLAHPWIKAQESSTSSRVKEIIQEGERLFPSGARCVRFGLLKDIAEEVVNRIINYFSPEKNGDVRSLSSRAESNVRRLTSFDCNTGWAAILLCESSTIVERDRQKIEPNIESDYYRIAAHSEFKGLIIQPREARSGIDDWLFVVTPPYRNLATIRSHETDVMYIGENHAFLYLPDDPQFLTVQYVESVRFADDIRNFTERDCSNTCNTYCFFISCRSLRSSCRVGR